MSPSFLASIVLLLIRIFISLTRVFYVYYYQPFNILFFYFIIHF